MFLLPFLLAISVALPAQDSTHTDIFEMKIEQLMNLKVVSSSKNQENQTEAPNAITAFSSEVIAQFGWNSINDILYKHQGFFPSHDFDRQTVGYRGSFEGWNNNHLLMLIDGVPFNDNLYGTAYRWDITPLIFTKSVEVIRGPGAALYGNNATNGVITLNTINAEDLGNQTAIVRSQFGQNNTHYHDLVLGFDTEKLDVVASASFRKTDGVDYMTYDASGKVDANGKLQKFQMPDAQNSTYFFVKLNPKQKLKGLSLQYHLQAWDFKTGHGWLWFIPDKNETMKEMRNIVLLKYAGKLADNIEQEYVVRFQQHNIDWDMWYYPSGAFDGFYPEGVNEYLKTSAQDIFTRLQYRISLPKKMNLLTGVETTIFLYDGDKEHYSNTDLLDELGFGYAPYTENQNLGSWLEPIEGNPLTNVGAFMQFSSGNALGEKLKATVGLRYDNEFFNYTTTEGQKNKSFDQLSPRIALVYNSKMGTTLKLMGGQAFRAPTPTEMFGANTWTLAANLAELVPEEITTAEFELKQKLSEPLSLGINTYYTKAAGQIAYSLGNNNLSTNIYDLTHAGFEAGLQAESDKWAGFFNAAYVMRLDESIYAAEKEWVSEHQDKLTWAPAITLNAGAFYHANSFSFSLSGHYQGEVTRRDLDNVTPTEYQAVGLTAPPRPEVVQAWFSLDSRMAYKISKFEVGLTGTNLLNSEIFLAKSLKYYFDYKMPARRVGVFVKISI